MGNPTSIGNGIAIYLLLFLCFNSFDSLGQEFKAFYLDHYEEVPKDQQYVSIGAELKVSYLKKHLTGVFKGIDGFELLLEEDGNMHKLRLDRIDFIAIRSTGGVRTAGYVLKGIGLAVAGSGVYLLLPKFGDRTNNPLKAAGERASGVLSLFIGGGFFAGGAMATYKRNYIGMLDWTLTPTND